MGPLWFMQPVVDRNVVMRRIPVICLYDAGPKIFESYSGRDGALCHGQRTVTKLWIFRYPTCRHSKAWLLTARQLTVSGLSALLVLMYVCCAGVFCTCMNIVTPSPRCAWSHYWWRNQSRGKYSPGDLPVSHHRMSHKHFSTVKSAKSFCVTLTQIRKPKFLHNGGLRI
jgi:hypothetical protein